MSKFVFERDLVSALLGNKSFLCELGYRDWACLAGEEFEGYFGVPDVFVAFATGDRRLVRTFAFEAKLSAWRQGLVQAYRYRAFAHYSFLVMDRVQAGTALKHIKKFRQARVGLITVDQPGTIVWHFRPPFTHPYCSPLARRLREEVLCVAQTTENSNGNAPLRRMKIISNAAEARTRVVFEERVKRWAHKLDAQVKSLSVRAMKTKWASYSTTGHMTIDASLLEMRRGLQDYVIVHELLNDHVRSHGKLWKSLMRTHIGDYEKCEKELMKKRMRDCG